MARRAWTLGLSCLTPGEAVTAAFPGRALGRPPWALLWDLVAITGEPEGLRGRGFLCSSRLLPGCAPTWKRWRWGRNMGAKRGCRREIGDGKRLNRTEVESDGNAKGASSPKNAFSLDALERRAEKSSNGTLHTR